MGQLREKLTNVKSYKTSIQQTKRRTKSTGIQLLLKNEKQNKKIRAIIDKLLSYEGYGEIEVPGSIIRFLPDITNLSVSDLAGLLEMSTSSYYRKIRSGLLEMDSVDKMSSLLKIYQKGIEAFEDNRDDFEEWLNTQIPNLGNKKPIELLKTENGRLAVLDAIDRVEHNVYG